MILFIVAGRMTSSYVINGATKAESRSPTLCMSKVSGWMRAKKKVKLGLLKEPP